MSLHIPTTNIVSLNDSSDNSFVKSCQKRELYIYRPCAKQAVKMQFCNICSFSSQKRFSFFDISSKQTVKIKLFYNLQNCI